jgi:hypothetical protein
METKIIRYKPAFTVANEHLISSWMQIKLLEYDIKLVVIWTAGSYYGCVDNTGEYGFIIENSGYGRMIEEIVPIARILEPYFDNDFDFCRRFWCNIY